MQYTFDGHNYVIRLDKGQHLKESLDRFISETGVEGAWISMIGGALQATLGFYDLESQEYQWRTFNGLYEITGMQGNLARDESGTIMYHLHGTLADANYQTIGGHVKDLVVGGTVEIFVHCLQQPLNRKTNATVGLQTLDLNVNA